MKANTVIIDTATYRYSTNIKSLGSVNVQGTRTIIHNKSSFFQTRENINNIIVDLKII